MCIRDRGKTILISSHILSEIALLADDIGIIDHGVLLEEESLVELEQKNGKVDVYKRQVPESQAVKEIGFFGNQNSVCRPRDQKWVYTVERLKKVWGIEP